MFLVSFLVAAVVTFVYRWISEGSGHVDWVTSFRLAVILTVILTIKSFLDERFKRKKV
ncbi:MAG: hypothetical protein GXO78_03225 [Calditrichaeota bacterium]|nr:hypothetical protein [Calditrichota bacterium]